MRDRQRPNEVGVSKPGELAKLISAHATADGVQPTVIPALHLYRSFTLSEPVHTLYKPSLCLVARGSKTVSLGRETVRR